MTLCDVSRFIEKIYAYLSPDPQIEMGPVDQSLALVMCAPSSKKRLEHVCFIRCWIICGLDG